MPEKISAPHAAGHTSDTSFRRGGNSSRLLKKRRSKSSQTFRTQLTTFLVRFFAILIAALCCYLAYVYVVAPYHSKWEALYGKETYPEGYSIRGIDVSHHQGRINWEELAHAQINEEPICFVFIKATEGGDFLDENFNENFYKSREIGLIRGAYHYFKPNVPAKLQAEYFLRQVFLEPGDLPPVLDIEEIGDLSPEELSQAALEWLSLVEKQYGVSPILYTNYKFKRDYLNTEAFENYPYWIAHYYVPNLTYKGAWKFWQHTDQGQIKGIRARVDLNVYNGSMYDLRRLCIPERD